MNSDIYEQFCVRPNARRQVPAQQSVPISRYCIREPLHQLPAVSVSLSHGRYDPATGRSFGDELTLAGPIPAANAFPQKGSSVIIRMLQHGQKIDSAQCTDGANERIVCQAVTGGLRTSLQDMCRTDMLNRGIGLPSRVTSLPPSADAAIRQSVNVMTSSSIMPDSASQFNCNRTNQPQVGQSFVVRLSTAASSALPRVQVFNQGQTPTRSALHHMMLQKKSVVCTESSLSHIRPTGQDSSVLTSAAAQYCAVLPGSEIKSLKVQGDQNFQFSLLNESTVPFAAPDGVCDLVTVPAVACQGYGNVSGSINQVCSMDTLAPGGAERATRIVKVEPVPDEFFEDCQGSTVAHHVQPGDIEENLNDCSDGLATLTNSEVKLPVPVVYIDRAVDESRASVNQCSDVNNSLLGNVMQSGQIPETNLPTSDRRSNLCESEVNRLQRKRKSSAVGSSADMATTGHESSYGENSHVAVISQSQQSGKYSLRTRSKSNSLNMSCLSPADGVTDEQILYSVDDENATDGESAIDDNSDIDPTWDANQSVDSDDDSSDQMDVQENEKVNSVCVDTDKRETDVEPCYVAVSPLRDVMDNSDSSQPRSQTSICATLCEKVTSYEVMSETCDTPAFVMECYDDSEQTSSNATRLLRPSAALVESAARSNRADTELNNPLNVKSTNCTNNCEKHYQTKKPNKSVVLDSARNAGVPVLSKGSNRFVKAGDSSKVSEASRSQNEPETDDVIILSDNRTSESVLQHTVQLAQLLSKGIDADLGKVPPDVFRAKRVPNNLALSRTRLRACGNRNTGLSIQIPLLRLDENSATLHRLIGWHKTPNVYTSIVGQQNCSVTEKRSSSGNCGDVGAWRNRLCFQCVFCPYTDSSVRKLAAHIKLRHTDLTFIMNITIPFPNSSIPFLFCRHCDFISYDKVVMLLHFSVFHSLSHIISDKSFRPSSSVAQTNSLSPTDEATVFPFYCCTSCAYMSASRTWAVDHVSVEHASKFSSCFVPLVMVGRSKSTSCDSYAKHANGAQYVMSRKLIFACVRCSFYSFYSFYAVSHNLHWHRTTCLVFVCDIVDPQCKKRFSVLDDVVRHFHLVHRKQNSPSNCFQLKVSVTLVDVQDALPVECYFAFGRITDEDVPKDVSVSRQSSADQLPDAVIEIDDDNDPDVYIVDSASVCSLSTCASATGVKEVRCKHISCTASGTDACIVTDKNSGSESSINMQQVLTDLNDDIVQQNASDADVRGTGCDETHFAVAGNDGNHDRSRELTATLTNEGGAVKLLVGEAQGVQQSAHMVEKAASANCKNNGELLSDESVQTAEHRLKADYRQLPVDGHACGHVSDDGTDTCHLTCSEDVSESIMPVTDDATGACHLTCSNDGGLTMPAASGLDESYLRLEDRLNSNVHDTRAFKSAAAVKATKSTKANLSRFRVLASYRFVQPSETVAVVDLEDNAHVPVPASIISAEELSLLNELP